jgi:hypothetical protein
VETALATAMRAETDRSVLLELIFDRLDPRPFAAIFLETVIESSNRYLTSKEGLEGLNKDWTVCVLRKWWMHSNLMGADTSWGMGRAVAQLLNISSLDLEDPEAMQLDFPAQTMTKRLQTLEQEMVAGTAELQHHPTYLSLLSQFSPRAAIYAVGTTADGLSVETNNEAFSMLFQGADRRYSSLVLHKTLPFILFLALVAPDDRREWSRFIIEACTRAPVEPEGNWRRTRIFKLVGAEGLIQLYLVEARAVPGLGLGGLALILEPCPPSRHLTKKPGWTPRADYRVAETGGMAAAVVVAASPSETAAADGMQENEVNRRAKGDGDRLTHAAAGEGALNWTEEDRNRVALPGIVSVPFSGLPASFSLQRAVGHAQERAVDAVFGLPFPLTSSSSSEQDDDERDRFWRRAKLAAGDDHALQLLFPKPPVKSALALTLASSSSMSDPPPSSSSALSSTSTSPSSSSCSSPSSSSLPPSLSSSTSLRPQCLLEQRHAGPVEPVSIGVSSPGADLDYSEIEPPGNTPVLHAAFLEAVFDFDEGGDAT